MLVFQLKYRFQEHRYPKKNLKNVLDVYVVVVCGTRVRANATITISLQFSENLNFKQN